MPYHRVFYAWHDMGLFSEWSDIVAVLNVGENRVTAQGLSRVCNLTNLRRWAASE